MATKIEKARDKKGLFTNFAKILKSSFTYWG
ncbi:uncharacterized protein METZ01_LOCUS430104 [marine metagenome]|uniref:Uncharacterized protein n=1 Tax=marine metagenome TaxID=408172 RepID=A0A382Y289_9ZZZZ